MPSGIDPKVDYAFKWVFGREPNKPLLIDLLNAVLQLPPGQETDCHSRFGLVDHATGMVFTADLEIHLFELAKFNTAADKLETALDQWL